ncbi:phosphoadenosine phosphosulfate reductase [Candidatus Nasuia deltocephalinicola]|uniref:Phosphoadenylyl-sulfate reductase n=1 Tax=Candidatus Nasuia deltocephalincola TaxID=1160784 RepID=A0A975A3R9_9PROT|nr:phosphoadenylyl-sulfate reductase [Candidatus Nasuia deltocephalinicola]BEH03880.1 phosphoadenosine phosphosulfate reductase [Candidatus Nasuia deltocephalinicola]
MKKKNIDFNPFFLKLINLNSRLEFLYYNSYKIVLSNSLNFEDIFLMFFINLKKFYINNFFLNTGKIFLNTFNFIKKINYKYKNKLFIYFPNFLLVYKYIKKFNFNSFYNNIILRKICCYIRKIEPYNKSLFNKEILITGLRSSRFNNNSLNYFFDKSRNIIKYNLLFLWDYKDIFYFFEKFNILLNFFYNYGFSSIGCEPCTRKVGIFEHIRSGRWYWENYFSKKECGLHL